MDGPSYLLVILNPPSTPPPFSPIHCFVGDTNARPPTTRPPQLKSNSFSLRPPPSAPDSAPHSGGMGGSWGARRHFAPPAGICACARAYMRDVCHTYI